MAILEDIGEVKSPSQGVNRESRNGTIRRLRHRHSWRLHRSQKKAIQTTAVFSVLLVVILLVWLWLVGPRG